MKKHMRKCFIGFFYRIKGHIPRWLQILARRLIARANRIIHNDSWPIDKEACKRPPVFKGWPGGKQFALVLRHDVETDFGAKFCNKIIEIEREFGMHSAFYFVPEDYEVGEELRRSVLDAGCEVGVQGLTHDGTLYSSRKVFMSQVARINVYMKQWGAVGFVSPSSHHRFDWIHDLDILYDSSSFDTDPFEPQPDGVHTIFPLLMKAAPCKKPYIELPYTLCQDFTVFVIFAEKDIGLWKKKIDWIAKNGGMALVVTHPDYMRFPGVKSAKYSYPSSNYRELLSYIESKYNGSYWQPLPREIAEFWHAISRE